MDSAAARLVAWRGRHPWLTGGGIALLIVVLLGGGYEGRWFLEGRTHLRAAQAALDRRDWSEARLQAEASLEAWPHHPAGHLLAARAARRLELLGAAAEHLDLAQRLQGGETQAEKVERALLRVHEGDLPAVETFLRSCVAQDDPDALEILDVLSAALLLDYRVAEAHRCLDELLRRQPNHFDALVRHGWTAQSQGWYSQAVASLEKALALRPEVDSVRLSLAEIQVTLGRFAEAQQHFTDLRQRQPQDPAVLCGLARCRAATGHSDEALALFDQVLAAHPDDWKARGERGWLCVQLDRPGEGEADLRRANALAPPDLALRVRLADCLRLLGKEDEARACREQADRLKADLQRAGELGDLIREQRPNDPALRHELACILLRLGKPRDAVHWFQTALAKDPRYRPTHEALAALCAQAGSGDQAAYHRRILQVLEAPNGGRTGP